MKKKDQQISVYFQPPQELIKQYRQDAKENLQNVKDLFHRISIQGGRYRIEERFIGDKGIEFSAVILREIPVNVYYQSPFDPANPVGPDCWSLGGLNPDGSSPQMESEWCLTCRWNKFGSGTSREGKRRGKACHNTRRLILKAPDVEINALLSLPPTAIKGFNNYLKELSSGEPPIPVYALYTVFGFDPVAQYPRPVLKRGEFLSVKQYGEIKQYRISQEVVDVLRAYATGEDYVTVDGEEKEEEEKKF